MPTELITLLGSSLLGGIMRIWARAAETRRQERLLHLQALRQNADIITAARKYENRGFQWTRRLIALTATFFIIAFPKIVAVWFPETPIQIGYPDLDRGFLFFSSDAQVINWKALQGLVITPLDTHLLSAIIGLYFGGSLTNR